LQEENAGVFDGSWHAKGKVCSAPVHTTTLHCVLSCSLIGARSTPLSLGNVKIANILKPLY